MIVLAVLLLLAAGCILGAPRLLGIGPLALERPRLVLAAWLGVFLLGGAAVLGSVVWSVLLALSAHPGAMEAGWLVGLVAWAALATTGAAAALVLTRIEPYLAHRGAADRDLDLLAAACTVRTDRIGRVPVLVVRADRPAAFSSTGDGGRIVITTALEAALGRGELRAVLEHERAHLDGRHDLLLRLAGLNRACLPALSAARAFDRAVHLLVELVADDRAARVCGAATPAAALRHAARLEANEWAEIRAARLVSRAAAARPAPRPSARPGPGLYKP